MVERNAENWSEPIHLDNPVNTELMDCYASFANNGNLYFHRFNDENGKGGADIFLSEYIDEGYSNLINLGDSINTKYHDWDVVIAPDESFMVFASFGRPDDMGKGDLYISLKKDDGSWCKAKNMGNKVNSCEAEICPSLSSDGKYLFFTSFRDGGGIYWLDLSKFIKEYKKKFKFN